MWMQLLMKKSIHTLGYIAQTATGTGVAMTWAEDFGYDIPSLLEDVTGDLLPEQYPAISYSNKVIFLSYPIKVSGTRTLKMTFLSGNTEKLEVFAPSIKRGSFNGVYQLSAKIAGGSSKHAYSMLVATGDSIGHSPSAVAMLPMNDPEKRFRYKQAWKGDSPGAVIELSSDVMGTLSKDLGLPSEATMDTQFCMFAHVLGAGDRLSTAEEVWAEAFEEEGDEVIFTWVWSKYLRPLPSGDYKEFYVCAENGSPNYYRTTGNDSAGNAIPALYLSGTLPARFIPDSCTVSGDDLQVSVRTTREVAGSDATMSISVTGTTATPKIAPWIYSNGYDSSRAPVYPALSGQNFTFTLRMTDGTNHVASGTQTGNTKSFTGLSNSKLPYLLTVEDDTTGAIRIIPIVISKIPTRYTEPKTNRSESPTNIPPRTTAEDITEFQEPPECPCNDGTSINTVGWAGPVDPCGVCFDCDAHGNLTRGGLLTGQTLLTNNGSFAVAALTFGGSTGKIVFDSSPTILDPDITTFLPTTFEIDLYSTTGPGVPEIGAAITSLNAHPNPDYTFTGLAAGWYVINIQYTGLGCNSKFWFYVNQPSEPENCWTDVEVSIDPCSGILNAEVTSSGAVESYTYAINGEPVTLPHQVVAGDTLLVKTTFVNEHCATHMFEQQITAADLICNSLDGFPVGCTDPTAVNFDPSATIDSGLCIHGIVGCIDPTASNYDPNATHGDSSCLYLCTEPVVSFIVVTGNSAAITLHTTQEVNVVWENTLTGNIIDSDDLTATLSDGAYVVTVTTSLGCVEIHVVSVNTPLVYGCMDRYASNFEPSANIPFQYWTDGASGDLAGTQCTYDLSGSPCLPKGLADALEGIDTCLHYKLKVYFNRLKAGMVTECELNKLRTASLIRRLLHRKGLECLYNCKDSGSPDYSTTVQGKPCSVKHAEGGPSGQNLIYDATVSYVFGDVVIFENEIYTMISQTPSLGLDPTEFALEKVWQICTEPFPLSGDNVIDPYLAFIAEYCIDCQLPKKVTITETSQTRTPDSINLETLSMGGETLEL
jgi:hypothetical protein